MVELGGKEPFHLVGSSGIIDSGEMHVELLSFSDVSPLGDGGIASHACRPMTLSAHPPTVKTMRQDTEVTRPEPRHGVDRPKLAAAEGAKNKL